MGAVNGAAGDDLWFGVEESSAAGQVRRAASALAARLGFSEKRIAEVAIAATELATNLQRHATHGTMLVRPFREDGRAAVELLAVDSGPGMSDLSLFSSDGYSTGGTLGIGIGAVMRLASSFDAHSVPGRGTVVVATFWPENAASPRPRVAGVKRAMNGETACGDAWASREDASGTALMLADGLGHGELAAIASREAVRTFMAQDEADAAGALHSVDRALRSTRGAAAAVLKFDRKAGTIDFAGVGNISAWIDGGGRRQGLISSPGIVGAAGPKRIRPVRAHLPEDAVVVMHSDGLSSKWDLNAYPGLRVRDLRLIAATLLRDAGVRHDDASIVVA